jgi:hypothetical protein
MTSLERLWAAVNAVEIDASLVSRAAALALERALRGHPAGGR